MALNLNTELALIDTNANAGTIVLPATSSSQGRVITFKDAIGRFGVNALTLITSGSDTFEDGSSSKVLRENNGIIQVVASGTTWYVLTGTQQNYINVSTLQVLNVSTSNISTANLLVSSLQYDSITPIFQQSSLVYYNSNVFAGSRVYPATGLNRFSFSLYQIPFFNMWLDANDPSTIVLNGSSVSRWNDKSFNSNFVSQASPVLQPTYTPPGIVFNLSRYFNTKLLLNVIQETIIGVVQFTNIVTACNILAGPFGARQIYITASSIRLGVQSRTNLIILDITSIGTNMFLFSVVYNYNSSLGAIFVNGGSLSASAAASVIANTPFTGTGLSQMGGINGTIYEILQYSNSLSTIQRQQVEGYLAWKWNLQGNLPASHPYKNAPPS